MRTLDQLVDELSEEIVDARVLAAVAAVDRARFVPHELQAHAYEDVALPLPGGQAISQPRVVARMLELLELTGDERVLDVGTGSGYHAALLDHLAGQVISIERDASLSADAARALADQGSSVVCVIGDGWDGMALSAPYDAINVAAAPGPQLPGALVRQLAPSGRLVCPLTDGDGDREHPQLLTRLRRGADGALAAAERFDRVAFVPLVGLRPRRDERS